MNGDDDADGYSNYAEYSMGGDPNSSTKNGYVPAYSTASGWFEMVHTERMESGLTPVRYTVDTCNNLVSNLWTETGVELTGYGPINSEFNSVTNRVPMNGNDQQFIRIRVQ